MTIQPTTPADWRCPLCGQAAGPDAFGRLTHLCTKKPSEWIRERAEGLWNESKHEIRSDQVPLHTLFDCRWNAVLEYLDLTQL
jgi:hypothetical protein